MHTIMAHRGIRSALLCAAASCACIFALVSPAASQAAETTIGTGGPIAGQSQGHFGDPATSTYGEVITAPVNGDLLDSFTFYLKVSPALGFRAYVYAWNGEAASGSLLYESATEHTTEEGSSFQPITASTGGIAVTPGQKYVIFFSVANNGAEDSGTGLGGEFAITPSSDYPEGFGAWLENGYSFEALTTTKWQTSSVSSWAFEARFSEGHPSVTSVSPTSTSEGETVTIEGANLGGVSEVLFGATPASGFTYVSEEEITAIVPSGVSGTVDVRVITGAGESPSVSGDQVNVAGSATTTTTTTAPTTTTTTSKTTPTTTTTTTTTTTKTTPTTTTTTTVPTTTTTTAPTTTTTTTSKTTTTTTTAPTTTTTTAKTTTTTTTSGSCHQKSCTTTTTTTTTPSATPKLTSNPPTTTSVGVTGISGAVTPATGASNAPDCVVPELHGMTLRAARLALLAAHCKLGATHHAFSEHKKDRVYRQSLKKDTSWPNGHRINVWDSLGLPPAS